MYRTFVLVFPEQVVFRTGVKIREYGEQVDS